MEPRIRDRFPAAGRATRFSLRAKLSTGVLLYLVLAVLGLLRLYAAEASLESANSALEHHVLEVSVLSELSQDVSRAQSTTLLHIITDSPADRSLFEQRLSQLQDDVDQLLITWEEIQRQFGRAPDLEPVDRSGTAWATYVQARDEDVLPLSREDRDTEALQWAQPTGRFDLAYRRSRTRSSNRSASAASCAQRCCWPACLPSASASPRARGWPA